MLSYTLTEIFLKTLIAVFFAFNRSAHLNNYVGDAPVICLSGGSLNPKNLIALIYELFETIRAVPNSTFLLSFRPKSVVFI